MKITTLLYLILSALCASLSLASGEDRPNFVFFITDDISAEDIGAYGSTVAKTPNLDAEL